MLFSLKIAFVKMALNALEMLKPRKDASLRFIDKLRKKKKDQFHVLVDCEIDGRLVIEEE